MELRQLKYLVMAIECGSMGKAAAELGMATSALSQQISRLEGELSTRLLVRGAGGVSPTEAGAAFCQHAMLALRHVDAASAAAQGARLTGVVALGLAPTTASVLAMPLIEAMARRYPLIRLQLVEGMSGHLAGMLKARQIDLAVLFNTESVTFARSEAIPLLDESLFLFGAVANSIDTMEVSQSKSPVTLAEAALLPLILPSRSHGLRVSLDRAFASANVSPRIIMEIDSLAVIMEAVSNRLGYTIQPGAALSRSAVGVFNVRPVADESVYRTNLLASLPEHELSPAALALRAQLRKTVGWLVREGRWLGTTLHES
ncbi:LysR family transcriptional regulator [Pararhizobium polonicum]|uniref:HTH-type transcriptional regulator TtuA n=1 Tax=Pararhizobium polonicum TaxID=1612624 RepID=A0A1C7NWN9_9HYPH|nr:LysR family transcriptional regulator [Pararhizobium polonicum]OBZ93437.1 LysR family transcriptional regulator [Pararhizobium polonicum]